MLTYLKSVYLKEQFRPSMLGIFFNPLYFARKEIAINIKLFSQYIKGKVLDIGCGNKPYKSFFPAYQYIGMDIRESGHTHEGEDIDIFYDGSVFPFNNNCFDSVVCFEVLEHVLKVDTFLNEINRVMKKGGYAIFTVPFIWYEHEKPYDYLRYSSFGLVNIFNKHGFNIVESRKYLNDIRLLFLLTNTYIQNVFKRLTKYKLGSIITMIFSSILNIAGHISFILPKNDDLYFGNIFLLQKKDVL